MQEHLEVYQRVGEPCRRCGHVIRRVILGGRATHFCSFCQRLPAVERAGVAAILATAVPRPGDCSGRRGRRWSELEGEAVVGRTAAEQAAARARRAREAAATRRAAARAGGG
jgi:hypothetical protein